MVTNTCKSGLEAFIVNHSVAYNGHEQVTSADYNCDYATDELHLLRLLEHSQPEQVKKLTRQLKRKYKTYFTFVTGDIYDGYPETAELESFF